MFKKATKTKAKLRLAIAGPSGSGKTLSALLIANGLGGRVAVIDTENNSASLYASKPGVPDFDVLNLSPPFTTERYLEAIQAAIQAKYDILIIDSLSHQWAGEGGLLNRKEQLDARGGNSFTNWSKFTPEHERFKSALLQSDIHLIGCLRSKQEYILADNGKGKQAPQKHGMAPIQRDGLEYEFTVMLDLDMNHQAAASKDRTGLFDKQLFVPSADTGRSLMNWLNDTKEPEPSNPEPLARKQSPARVVSPVPLSNSPARNAQKPSASSLNGTGTFKPSQQDIDRLKDRMERAGWNAEQLVGLMHRCFSKSKLSELEPDEFERLIESIWDRTGISSASEPLFSDGIA